jgi:2-keto-4-pentenoate hydratase
VDAVDPQLVAALTRQLELRRGLLSQGARRVGWKLGVGEAERIGRGPVVGHLTSATQLEPGGVFESSRDGRLHADVELAAVFGSEARPGEDVIAAVSGWGAALELVDLRQAGDAPQAIVETNVFHRAFALGPAPAAAGSPPDGLTGKLWVNGEIRAGARVPDVEDRLRSVPHILASVGESLRPGDRVITGSIVQEPVQPGDVLVADLGPLGSVTLNLAFAPRRTGNQRA